MGGGGRGGGDLREAIAIPLIDRSFERIAGRLLGLALLIHFGPLDYLDH